MLPTMTSETPALKFVNIARQGSVAVVMLDRPKALNALTCSMRADLVAAFPRFAREPNTYAAVIRSTSPKAFSAGSDVREVIDLARQDIGRARQTFRDEYALNWQIECFSKPTVSLIDGMVMGGGVGISLYGTHRVAGPRYKFAMPETLIGLFPDVGVCHTFARMPHHIGTFLALTGHAIGRAEAYRLGLVTHCIDPNRYDEIIAGLADAQTVDPLLDDRHVEPGPDELEPFERVIADCFSAPSVEEMLARLKAVSGAQAPWCERVVADLAARSPLSLKITHRHLSTAVACDLRQVLQMDYRLVCRCLDASDFYEGVRAALIDKTGHPAWDPARLEDVTPDIIDSYFANMGAAELTLPTRQEMQAARA